MRERRTEGRIVDDGAMTPRNDLAALTSGRNFWSTEQQDGLPAITLTDGPHGVRMQASDSDMFSGRPATCFPPATATASTWDPDLLRRMGEALATEARSMDVSVLLGPGINIKRSPLGGRNFEYFSEDPLLTGTLAAAYVQGVQSRGVGTSLKHFAVNSQETDRMRVSAEVDERTLREIYLRAFQRVVEQAQPWTVMCSYNRINGVHASRNRWLLTDVLRGEWGFEGAVVSDWGAVVDRVDSIAAGLDLTMPGPDAAGDQRVADAAESGALDPGALETAAARVRALVERAQDASGSVDVDHDAHHALAREIASRAIVLLKNDGLLPLAPGSGSIAVLGEIARTPRYQGGGSSQITPTRLDDALSAITAAAQGEVAFAPGYDADHASTEETDADDGLLNEAVELARTHDIALVFVGNDPETEGMDRTTLALPEGHLALVERVRAVNENTVVVLSNGGVVLTSPWDTDVPAILETWLLGQAGGGAIADVLFGVVNPSGRLAETVPLRLEDHPSYLDFPGEHGVVRYGEGIHVGYRGFDARETDVSYPFGWGLSYTTFEYGDVTATVGEHGIDVTVPVTNTGDRDGREVVQIYVSAPDEDAHRVPRELAAFESVEIAAGATETVTLTVRRADLAYWDTRVSCWIVAPGEYVVAAAASSRDLRSVAIVSVTGDDVRLPLTAESTVTEWLDDPRGGDLLRTAIEDGDGPSVAQAMMGNPETAVFLSSVPLARMVAFGDGTLTPDVVARLVQDANG